MITSATVLVVDDDVRVLKLISQMLRLLGIHVLEASTPRAASRLFESEPGQIDMLISDVRMPGLTGPELAVHLRSIKPDLPVILMTGYAEWLEPQWEVLQKPFQMTDLQRKVSEAIGSIVEA